MARDQVGMVTPSGWAIGLETVPELRFAVRVGLPIWAWGCLAVAAAVAIAGIVVAQRDSDPDAVLRHGTLSHGTLRSSNIGPTALDDESQTQLSSNFRRAIDALLDEYRRAGDVLHDRPLLLVWFDYPANIRLGNESQMILHVACRFCGEEEIRFNLSGEGVKVGQPVPSLLRIRGNADHDVRVLLSPESEGLKTVVVSASTRPDGSKLFPASAHIRVLPELSVLGVPRRYWTTAGMIAAAILASPLVLLALRGRRAAGVVYPRPPFE